MNIFDPATAIFGITMIALTQPIVVVPAIAGILIYSVLQYRKWRARRVAADLAKTREGRRYRLHEGDVPVMIAMGEYSFDGGTSWHQGSFEQAFRAHNRLDEPDQFGGFARTPRYRHSDK